MLSVLSVCQSFCRGFPLHGPAPAQPPTPSVEGPGPNPSPELFQLGPYCTGTPPPTHIQTYSL